MTSKSKSDFKLLTVPKDKDWVRPDNHFGMDNEDAMADYKAKCLSHKQKVSIFEGEPHHKCLFTCNKGMHYSLCTTAPMFMSAFHT